jgi:phi13 family phage major tail protein
MPTVGLRDLHFAILTEDNSEGVAYETPKKMGAAISANISPTVNDSTLYAEDGPADSESSLGAISVAINTRDLTKEVQAALLGHTVNSEGVLIKKSTDAAPYVAIGFRSQKSGGGYRYKWFYKGKFRPQEQNHQTKGETPEFQTPTLNATFLRRDYDDQWEATVDSDDSEVNEGVFSTWFNAVYEEAGEA